MRGHSHFWVVSLPCHAIAIIIVWHDCHVALLLSCSIVVVLLLSPGHHCHCCVPLSSVGLAC